MRRFNVFSMAVMALAVLFQPSRSQAAHACPFCTSASQTFSEELGTMDVAVIARLVQVPPQSNKAGDEIQKATFEVEQVIKGEGLVKPQEKLETLYFGDGTVGKPFLVMGISPPATMWSTPLPLTDRGMKYLTELVKLPKDGADRLIFFQQYLEDTDEMLARDAYDEFARAPYAQLKSIKPQLKHDQVVAWIKNPEIPASRRRLYLVILGITGTEKDLPMIEDFMTSSDRKAKSGLDALIACYLTLKGEAGLPLVEKLFLGNDKADYADTYAAIMAIRFHGSEGGLIGTKQLVKALHPMLDRPELADLVIPDLAKWEDWGVMDKLFDLYKNANEKNSWVRVPVVNYLRACPLPKAKELLSECEKIDPAAVKRANTFFPGAPSAPAPSPDKASQAEPPAPMPAVAAVEAHPMPTSGTLADAGQVRAASSAAALAGIPLPPADDEKNLALALNEGVRPAAALRKTAPSANLLAVLGVPWGIGAVLLFAQWSLLRGGQ
ncbi:MAG TPA: hypothetical protein VGI40_19125 [Pirellulaceae bacterium]|jgi:hypothetical protein